MYNRLWIVDKNGVVTTLEEGSKESKHGRCPAFSPDGNWVSCVSGRPRTDYTEETGLAVWIIKSDGSKSYKLTDETYRPTHMTWSPDQTTLAVTGAYGLQLIPLPDIFQ